MLLGLAAASLPRCADDACREDLLYARTGVTQRCAAPPQEGSDRPCAGEKIRYQRLGGGPIYEITTDPGATPRDVTAALQSALDHAGDLVLMGASPDGAWLLLEALDFAGCGGQSCLVLVAADLSRHVVVRDGAKPIVDATNESSATAGVWNDDLVVVFGREEEARFDLWVARWDQDATWRAVTRLTDGSECALDGGAACAYHGNPSLSSDGARVAFECREQKDLPDGADVRSALCGTGLDGSGFETLLTDGQVPAAASGQAPGVVVHPAWDGADGVVFAAAWDEEGFRLWRRPPEGWSPASAVQLFWFPENHDHFPLVLPSSGCIASLWTGHGIEGRGGMLKVMTADGAEHEVFDLGEELWDLRWGVSE